MNKIQLMRSYNFLYDNIKRKYSLKNINMTYLKLRPWELLVAADKIKKYAYANSI